MNQHKKLEPQLKHGTQSILISKQTKIIDSSGYEI